MSIALNPFCNEVNLRSRLALECEMVQAYPLPVVARGDMLLRRREKTQIGLASTTNAVHCARQTLLFKIEHLHQVRPERDRSLEIAEVQLNVMKHRQAVG